MVWVDGRLDRHIEERMSVRISPLFAFSPLPPRLPRVPPPDVDDGRHLFIVRNDNDDADAGTVGFFGQARRVTQSDTKVQWSRYGCPGLIETVAGAEPVKRLDFDPDR